MSRVLGHELLRIQRATETRDATVAVRSSMRSQYEPGDNREGLIRTGILDIINDEGLGSLGAVSASVGVRQRFNSKLRSTPGFYAAVNALPLPFTATQKSNIKRNPSSFLEELVNANKRVFLRIISQTLVNALEPAKSSIYLFNPIARKNIRFNLRLSTRSHWAEILASVLAVGNRYPAQYAMALGQVKLWLLAGNARLALPLGGMQGLGEAVTFATVALVGTVLTGIIGILAVLVAGAAIFGAWLLDMSLIHQGKDPVVFVSTVQATAPVLTAAAGGSGSTQTSDSMEDDDTSTATDGPVLTETITISEPSAQFAPASSPPAQFVPASSPSTQFAPVFDQEAEERSRKTAVVVSGALVVGLAALLLTRRK